MAVVHGEQRLQPGHPRLHGVTRMAFRGNSSPRMVVVVQLHEYSPKNHSKRGFVGSGSCTFRGCCEKRLCPLGCWCLWRLPADTWWGLTCPELRLQFAQGKACFSSFSALGLAWKHKYFKKDIWHFLFGTRMKTEVAPVLEGFTNGFFPSFFYLQNHFP